MNKGSYSDNVFEARNKTKGTSSKFLEKFCKFRVVWQPVTARATQLWCRSWPGWREWQEEFTLPKFDVDAESPREYGERVRAALSNEGKLSVIKKRDSKHAVRRVSDFIESICISSQELEKIKNILRVGVEFCQS